MVLYKSNRRSTLPRQCEHRAPVVTEQVQGGYFTQCLLCGSRGPISKSAEKAWQSLRELGMRSSSKNGLRLPD